MNDYDKILEELKQLPQTWHQSGPLDDHTLKALANHCRDYGPIHASLETGAGKSTLFFSRVSQHHAVFAIDIGRSLSMVKESELLNPESVEFIEGPTQRTLPNYAFSRPLDVVLIDGPHGYPFPDLEYYYCYPHIKQGGLLIIDDINIPSIKRMADIVQCDEMFNCVQVIGKTMILRRTDAPVFDPLADGWWDQNYNKRHLYWMERLEAIRRRMPSWLYRRIPARLRLRLQKHF